MSKSSSKVGFLGQARGYRRSLGGQRARATAWLGRNKSVKIGQQLSGAGQTGGGAIGGVQDLAIAECGRTSRTPACISCSNSSRLPSAPTPMVAICGRPSTARATAMAWEIGQVQNDNALLFGGDATQAGGIRIIKSQECFHAKTPSRAARTSI